MLSSFCRNDLAKQPGSCWTGELTTFLQNQEQLLKDDFQQFKKGGGGGGGRAPQGG